MLKIGIVKEKKWNQKRKQKQKSLEKNDDNMKILAQLRSKYGGIRKV